MRLPADEVVTKTAKDLDIDRELVALVVANFWKAIAAILRDPIKFYRGANFAGFLKLRYNYFRLNNCLLTQMEYERVHPYHKDYYQNWNTVVEKLEGNTHNDKQLARWKKWRWKKVKVLLQKKELPLTWESYYEELKRLDRINNDNLKSINQDG